MNAFTPDLRCDRLRRQCSTNNFYGRVSRAWGSACRGEEEIQFPYVSGMHFNSRCEFSLASSAMGAIWIWVTGVKQASVSFEGFILTYVARYYRKGVYMSLHYEMHFPLEYAAGIIENRIAASFTKTNIKDNIILYKMNLLDTAESHRVWWKMGYYSYLTKYWEEHRTCLFSCP